MPHADAPRVTAPCCRRRRRRWVCIPTGIVDIVYLNSFCECNSVALICVWLLWLRSSLSVLQESGGPLDKSLVRGMRHSHPADARVHARSPARPVRFPPTLICPGPLSKTPPRGFLQSRKFTYFHLISHQYEMGSHERARFTLQRGALFREGPLIEASPVSL